MRFGLQILVLFLLNVKLNLSEVNNSSEANEWNEYKSRFNVDNERFEIFNENMKKIDEHNNRPTPRNQRAKFKMGPNHFTHLKIEEISDRYLSEINITEIEYSARFLNKKNKEPEEVEEIQEIVNCTKKKKPTKRFGFRLSDSVDWSSKGVLSPVTDQGSCGSCYAFSTAWAIESAFAIKHNVRFNVNEFSKQQLVDCTYYDYKDDNNIVYSNVGCLGGNIYRTLLYVFNNGLMLEADYPYISEKMPSRLGKIQNCRFSSNKFALKIRNYYGINYKDVNEIKRVVRQQPVIAYFYATNDFYFYKSGIFTTNNCGRNNCGRVNHSVLIVGYGVENGISYWLCKNSWGPNWGENGYFRIEMNSNMCCVEGYNMYPYL